MKKLILLTFFFAVACNTEEPSTNDEPCNYIEELHNPAGYTVKELATINLDGAFRDFQFLNEELGFVLLIYDSGSDPEIFKTTDGGNTWVSMNLDIYDGYPQGIQFLDEDHGILTVSMVDSRAPTYMTNDGGLSWTLNEIDELRGHFIDITSDKNGNLFGQLFHNGGFSLYKSNDIGQSWNPIFNSENPDVNIKKGFFKVVNEIIYFTTTEGEIIGIDSDGNIQVRIETFTNNLNQLIVIDEENMIINSVQRLTATNNGGSSWYSIIESPSKIVGFDNQLNGVIITFGNICQSSFEIFFSNDQFISTNTAGENWNEKTGSTSNLYSNFNASQKVANGKYYMFVGKTFYELKKD